MTPEYRKILKNHLRAITACTELTEKEKVKARCAVHMIYAYPGKHYSYRVLTRPNAGVIESKSFRESFVWAGTKQGHEYWDKLNDKVYRRRTTPHTVQH